MIRVLPWDFKTSFPEPLLPSSVPDLVEAGDHRGSALRTMHIERIRQGLDLLTRLDTIAEGQRLGMVPETTSNLKDDDKNAELHQRSASEQSALQTALELLVREYAITFGKPAAEAFHAALRLWDMGGAVTTALPPVSPALPDAVRRANFGYEEDGTAVDPSAEEVLEISQALA
jgi:hypothetical protein